MEAALATELNGTANCCDRRESESKGATRRLISQSSFPGKKPLGRVQWSSSGGSAHSEVTGGAGRFRVMNRVLGISVVPHVDTELMCCRTNGLLNYPGVCQWTVTAVILTLLLEPSAFLFLLKNFRLA